MNHSHIIDNPEKLAKLASESTMMDGEEKALEFLFNQSSFLHKPNKSRREFAKFYKFLIEETKPTPAEESYFSPPQPFMQSKRSREVDFLYNYLLMDNYLGRLINSSVALTIDPGRQHHQIRELLFRNRANQLRLVSYAHKNDHGNFPETLEDLTPDYVSEIPEDPFDEGKKLQYSKDEGIIYSTKIDEVSEDERENYLIHLD